MDGCIIYLETEDRVPTIGSETFSMDSTKEKYYRFCCYDLVPYTIENTIFHEQN